MRSLRLLVLTMFVLPVAAGAQRGGGSSGAPPVSAGAKVERGDRRGNYNVNLGDGSFPITITNKDVESLSPVKVLLDKKKDLSLTEDQVKQLKDMDGTLKTENDTLFRQLDSLRKEMRVNKNAANPQVEQLRVGSARRATGEVIKAIKESYDKAEPAALAKLTEAQQKPASDLLDKHQGEAEEMLRAKLTGGKRGG